MRNTTFPLMLVVFGAAWLAHEAGWFSDWVSLVAIALIIIGAAIPLTEGINRSSVVAGPMLIYCGVAWILYLHDKLSERVVWPLGIIIWGLLLLVSRLPQIPNTRRRRTDPSELRRPPPPV
jgi:hypothetical protein